MLVFTSSNTSKSHLQKVKMWFLFFLFFLLKQGWDQRGKKSVWKLPYSPSQAPLTKYTGFPSLKYFFFNFTKLLLKYFLAFLNIGLYLKWQNLLAFYSNLDRTLAFGRISLYRGFIVQISWLQIERKKFLEEGLVNLYTSLANSRTVSPMVIVKTTFISWINGMS